MVRVAGKLPLLLLYNTRAMSVDSGERRVGPESAFFFSQQAARFHRGTSRAKDELSRVN